MLPGIRPLRALSPLAGLLPLLVISACSSSETGEELSPHAIHSEKLQTTMRHLDRLATKRMPHEFDVERSQRRALQRIQEDARELAEAALEIPSVLEEVRLDEEHREDFLSIAALLEARSRALQEDALDLSRERIGERVQEIMETCSTCHTRYRVLPALPARPTIE